MPNDKLQKVITAIDQANAGDPNKAVVGGQHCPYEQAYSEWMTGWVKRLEPEASEELLIAAHGQHICRWEIPRGSYPMDRAGYLKWREMLKQMHAERVGKIMSEAGYPSESVQKVQRIILKKNIRDPESQAVEDALCLVFLEHQFDDLMKKEPEEKMVEILRKTWRKMGEKGRAEALKLPLSPAQKNLVGKALSG